MTLIVESKYYSHIENNGDEIVALDKARLNSAVEHITTDIEKKLVLVVTHAMVQYYVPKSSDKNTEFVNRFRVYRGYITHAHKGKSGNVKYIHMVNASDVPDSANVSSARSFKINGLIMDIIPIDREESTLEQFEK